MRLNARKSSPRTFGVAKHNLREHVVTRLAVLGDIDYFYHPQMRGPGILPSRLSLLAGRGGIEPDARRTR
jgi:hypothetical protein